jgi:hypothetical protein
MRSRKSEISTIYYRALLIILLILIILIIFLPQPPANVIVSPPNKTVIQGQSFDLNVSIAPLDAAISGAQLDIAFNQSLLRLNSVTEGNLFKQKGASTYFNNGTINNTAGTVKNIFGVILGPGSISTNGTFIRLNLTVIGQSGISEINLSNVLISDPDATAVPLNTTNASITINSAPVMASIGNKNTTNGQNLTFTVSANDINGDTLTYSASNLPTGATFIPSTATFQWTPAQSGVYQNVHFEVTDGGLAVSENITITVIHVNRAPTFTSIPSNDSVFNETDIIYISVNATDPDNDIINYSIKIDNAQVSTSSSYNWTTNYNDAGHHEINISVSDGTELVSNTISIYINVYPRYDVNEDHIVNMFDFVLIGQHFSEVVAAPYPRYDVSMDGVVNIIDIVIAGQHFGEAT